jgi:hypothetical protein
VGRNIHSHTNNTVQIIKRVASHCNYWATPVIPWTQNSDYSYKFAWAKHNFHLTCSLFISSISFVLITPRNSTEPGVPRTLEPGFIHKCVEVQLHCVMATPCFFPSYSSCQNPSQYWHKYRRNAIHVYVEINNNRQAHAMRKLYTYLFSLCYTVWAEFMRPVNQAYHWWSSNLEKLAVN